MAEREPGIAKAVVLGIVTAVVHVALWMTFVFKLSGPEWTLGVIGAVVAAFLTVTFLRSIRRERGMTFHFSWGMIVQGWRLPWYVLSDSAKVGMALGKQLFTREGADSYLAAAPYDACSDSADDAGKRALEVIYSTSTPNGVVLGVVQGQGLMVFHQVKKDALSTMTEKLGAHTVKGER